MSAGVVKVRWGALGGPLAALGAIIPPVSSSRSDVWDPAVDASTGSRSSLGRAAACAMAAATTDGWFGDLGGRSVEPELSAESERSTVLAESVAPFTVAPEAESVDDLATVDDAVPFSEAPSGPATEDDPEAPPSPGEASDVAHSVGCVPAGLNAAPGAESRPSSSIFLMTLRGRKWLVCCWSIQRSRWISAS